MAWNKNSIRAEVQRRGSNLTAIATAAGIDPSACRSALVRRHLAGERAIAEFLGLQPEALWPTRYSKPSPLECARRALNGATQNSPISDQGEAAGGLGERIMASGLDLLKEQSLDALLFAELVAMAFEAAESASVTVLPWTLGHLAAQHFGQIVASTDDPKERRAMLKLVSVQMRREIHHQAIPAPGVDQPECGGPAGSWDDPGMDGLEVRLRAVLVASGVAPADQSSILHALASDTERAAAEASN
ncbi:helix-turn-helix domain-containing protein (plasmid) [Xanthobacter dioxanivorans]|uniref:Helix-turn-helix domain-containing protein n=2 Tax=Xanthobacteraceae TaxID=335928 RepID=A0A974PV26_9HYPH|nr:helix-turn-helix domain-containing protein [Xanthobacter dioxanivorans]